MRQTIPLRGSPPYQYLLSHRSPVAIENVQADVRLADVKHLTESRGTVSLLIIPLIIADEIAGAITLGTIAPRSFTREEINLSANVAGQVVGVLARLQLQAERQQLAEQYYQVQKMEAIGQLTAGPA